MLCKCALGRCALLTAVAIAWVPAPLKRCALSGRIFLWTCASPPPPPTFLYGFSSRIIKLSSGCGWFSTLWRYSVRILAGIEDVLSEAFRYFPQSQYLDPASIASCFPPINTAVSRSLQNPETCQLNGNVSCENLPSCEFRKRKHRPNR
jgi:hypothetical protein